ncbi:unnamed protein product, partial [Amoebophrya sp. A25]|eukprot:GSA25T00022857001.1
MAKRQAALRQSAAPRPTLKDWSVNLSTDPIYRVCRELATNWSRRISYRQPGPTQFNIKGDGLFRTSFVYSTALDYSYTILAEYLSLDKLREATVLHNNSTVLAGPPLRNPETVVQQAFPSEIQLHGLSKETSTTRRSTAGVAQQKALQ